jgi:uncharacterized membrane protein
MKASGDTGDTAIVAPTTGRWLRLALAISVALNLAILGIVAGAMIRNHGSSHDGAIARDLGFGPFTEALSDEDRKKLRQAFLAKVPELRDDRRAMRLESAALLSQLRAVPFDTAGLRKVFESQRQRNVERLDLGQTLMLDLVVGMTDSERIAFAARLEVQLAKKPKRRDVTSAP